MKRSSKVNPLEAHVGYWLRFVSNHVSHAFGRKLEAEGVTVAEWVVLRELLRLGEVVPSNLAESLGMTRGAVSKLLDRLAAKELVARVSEERDRRYQRVELTAAGRSLVPRLARTADENDAEFFGHLDEAKRNELIELLREIVRRQGLKAVPTD